MKDDNKIRVETRLEAATGHRRKFLTKACKYCDDRRRYTANGMCVTCQINSAALKSRKISLLLKGAIDLRKTRKGP